MGSLYFHFLFQVQNCYWRISWGKKKIYLSMCLHEQDKSSRSPTNKFPAAALYITLKFSTNFNALLLLHLLVLIPCTHIK